MPTGYSLGINGEEKSIWLYQNHPEKAAKMVCVCVCVHISVLIKLICHRAELNTPM